jgi:peptidyl-prolyl cis-trans isomerase SurA
MMKRTFGIVGSAILVAVCAVPQLFAAHVIERIIARVNTEIITQRQYERERTKLREQLSQDNPGPDLDARFKEESKNLLRDLIDQSLMVQKAKDLDINVETDIIKRLDEIRKQSNLANLEDLQKEVEHQGVVWEDFKDQIRRQTLMREVIGREVGSRIMTSREEARQFYEAHKSEFQSAGMIHLAEVLISSEKYKPDEAEKRAKAALAEIKAGQRFGDVVKKYSDGPNLDQGGDIGLMKTGSVAPAIADAIGKLEPNDTTDLIQAKNGYLILKLLERFSPGIPKFEEVEQRVDEALYNQKMQPQLRTFLVQLRKDSYIWKAPGYIDTGEETPGAAVVAEKGK